MNQPSLLCNQMCKFIWFWGWGGVGGGVGGGGHDKFTSKGVQNPMFGGGDKHTR